MTHILTQETDSSRLTGRVSKDQQRINKKQLQSFLPKPSRGDSVNPGISDKYAQSSKFVFIVLRLLIPHATQKWYGG